MEHYLAGEYWAFQELYLRFHRRLAGYFRSKNVSTEALEDLVQNTFQKLHASRAQFKPYLSFEPWLFTLAYTTWVDWVRKNARHHEGRINDSETHMAQIADIQPLPDSPQLPTERLFSGLSQEDQGLLLARFVEEKSYEEIARETDLKPATLRKRISRLAALLKKQKGETRP